MLSLILENLLKLIDNIKKAGKSRKAKLKGLPAARTTESEQRIYLLEKVTKFMGLAEAATYSYYSKYEDFFSDYNRSSLWNITGPSLGIVRKRKLQSTIRGLNRVFSAVIQQHGQSTIVDNQPGSNQDPEYCGN